MLFLVPVVLPESFCDSRGLGETCLYCSDPNHSLPSVKYAHFMERNTSLYLFP